MHPRSRRFVVLFSDAEFSALSAAAKKEREPISVYIRRRLALSVDPPPAKPVKPVKPSIDDYHNALAWLNLQDQETIDAVTEQSEREGKSLYAAILERRAGK